MLWLTLLLLATLLQAAAVLVMESKRPANIAAWLLIILMLPILGFGIYYFMARGYHYRTRLEQEGLIHGTLLRIARDGVVPIMRPADMDQPDFMYQERLFRIMQSMREAPITGCNAVQVISNPVDAYDQMLKDMEQAEHHIHLASYTLRDDKLGRQFQQLMMKKAREGVQVRLLVDGIGSSRLPAGYTRKLQKAGVEVHRFLPPLLSILDRRINYRNHRKLLIVDGKAGYVGGLNIGDEYMGLKRSLGYWRDTHLRVEGDSVYFMQSLYLHDWRLTSGCLLLDKAYWPEHACKGADQVQLLPSGPAAARNYAHELFFAAMSAAKSRIYITTPYFIPDEALLASLRCAAYSGVDVRIIVPGNSDSKLTLAASLSYLEELLRAGVRVYRYQRGFVHAKSLIIDELAGVIGTANLDMRSLFSNFEVCAWLYDQKLISRLHADFERDVKDSLEVTLEEFEERSWLQKGAEAAARLLSPLL